MSALDTVSEVPDPGAARPDSGEVTGWLLEGRWFTIDLGGNISAWSPAAAERFGYDRKSISGQSFAESLVGPAGRPACAQAVAAALEGAAADQAGFTGELDALGADGRPFRTAFALVPIQLSVGYEFNALLQEISSRSGNAGSLGELRARHESVFGLIQSALNGSAADAAQTENGGRLAGALVVFRAVEETAATPPPDNVVSIADIASADDTRTQLDRARAELEEARQEIQRARNEADVARQETGDERDALALAQRQAAEAQRQVDELRRVAEDARASAESFRIRSEAVQREADGMRAELRDARDAVRGAMGQADDELVEVRAEADRAREESQRVRGELDRAREEGERVRAELERTRSEVVEARGEAETARAETERARSEAADARAEGGRHAAEVEGLRERLLESRRELGELRAEVESARAELAQGAAVSERRGSEAERLRAELEEGERRLEEARAESERLTAELNREAADAADGVAQLERARAELEAARAAGGPVPSDGEHARLRAVFHGAPIATALVATDGRFVDANVALCTLLGHARERLVGDSAPPLVHPDDVEGKLALAERMLAGEQATARGRRRYLHASGHAVTVRESLALLRDAAGEPELFVLQVEESDAEVAPEPAVVDAELAAEELDAPSEEALRRALEEERFELHGQPVLDLRTNQVAQYELLIRMTGEDGRLILPQAFLGPARRAGLAHAIDRWVVREAIGLLARSPDQVALEVNLSPEAIHDADLATVIDQELASTPVDPGRLILEVAGQTAAEDLEATRALAARVRALGCRFALDDFRSTFGSFRLLKDLPLDYLKLDGELVGSLPESRTSQLILKALVEVAAGTGTKTVAVFVSDEDTLALLRQQGVGYAQGYRVGRPRPVADIWPGNEPAALPAGA